MVAAPETLCVVTEESWVQLGNILLAKAASKLGSDE